MINLRNIDAKRVIIALARMMGYNKVVREKCNNWYRMLFFNRYTHIYLEEVSMDTASPRPHFEYSTVMCKNKNWLSLLNNLENRIIWNPIQGNITISTIEELIIKLQLEGWLKPLDHGSS